MAIHPFLKGVLDSGEVINRVNKRFDSLFHTAKDGKRSPYVCSVCDEFLLDEQDVCVVTLGVLKKCKELLSWSCHKDSRRKPALEQYYRFRCGDKSFDDALEGYALSSRGVVHKTSEHGNTKLGITCCKRCKNAVDHGRRPLYAIINKNYVGGAPKCLRDLNATELALLTPVKHHGYCFTYNGGRQQLLKGTLTFMRVQKRSIAKSVCTLEAMGFTKHILVIFTGNLTRDQRAKAVQKSTIRTNFVIPALNWLKENHFEWRHVDVQALKDSLAESQPEIVDRSTDAESGNSNVESEEAFTCYYPDGATTPEKGGFDEPGAFKSFVERMEKEGFGVEFKMDLQREFVKGDDNDILLNSSLLQFPYGICGTNESRSNSDGKESKAVDLQEYLIHLTKLSQPVFQTPLFELIMYSLLSKQRLLRNSRLKLKTDADASLLADGLRPEDLHDTIRRRRRGNKYVGTKASRKLLDAVDACARALPHTNEASRKARGEGESMQHHFGMGSLFLTVAFDDENSLLMQVMGGVQIDDDEDPRDIPTSTLSERAKEREQYRIRYPGIAALNYEILLKVLVEEICGWDMNRNRATTQAGAFGELEAFQLSNEEQGRKTIHGHMILWIKGYRQLHQDLFWGSNATKKKADEVLRTYFEHIADTSLFPTKACDLKTVFDHVCSTNKNSRDVPLVVDDQKLRELRHKFGYKSSKGVFARCPQCATTWTYEEMIADLMSQPENMPQGPVEVNDEFLQAKKRRKVGDVLPKARMFATIIQYQKNGKEATDAPAKCINAVYNAHLSCHVTGCFKCNKNRKRGHECGPTCECRYRLPDMRRPRSKVRKLEEGVDWYEWNGKKRQQPIVQILPKRTGYDLFQNVCAKVVSLSKFSCNSNVSLITDGPLGQYTHKYQTKENNNEETAEYAGVEAEVKKIDGRKHENDRSEAVRRIVRASFAHNKTNIISPCFANYLIRHDSRFYTSHKFQYCPLKDVVKIHNKNVVDVAVRHYDGNSFFENQALHYLCRHESLEKVSLKEFVERWEVCYVPKPKKGKKNKQLPTNSENEDIFPFIPDTGYHKHPSVVTEKGAQKGKCFQAVKERAKPVLAKIIQWIFPDTAEFKCDIRNCTLQEMNKQTETYAQLVLTLLVPHRQRSDLMLGSRYPYTHKFQDIYRSETEGLSHTDLDALLRAKTDVFTEKNIRFLQNIQDCRKNSLRYRMKGDELAAHTVPLDVKDLPGCQKEQQDKEEDNLEVNATYETFLNACGEEEDDDNTTDYDPGQLNQALQKFSFYNIRKRGIGDCGMCDDVPVPVIDEEDTKNFVKYNFLSSTPNIGDKAAGQERIIHEIDDIVQLLLRRAEVKVKKVIWRDSCIEASDANGSIQSIREWGKAAFGTDKKQRRAFEVIVSSFLLTFYNEAPDAKNNAGTEATTVKRRFLREKHHLKKLQGLGDKNQLVCLLHGAGGSGKSTVINTVKAYAKDFCRLLNHPFTARTIVVTAMSGVAATLLNGETTHSVLGLNRATIKSGEQDDFADTRLVIIDEISFASARNFEKIEHHLSLLMHEAYEMYGGANIVFAGDYSQMEPVKDDPVYAGYKKGKRVPAFHHNLNCFIELDGKWRFSADPKWGAILLRFRDGVPTMEDVEFVNANCSIETKPPVEGMQVATYANKDRDAVNCSIFERLCEANKPAEPKQVFYSAVAIFMDDLEMHNSGQVYTPARSNAVKRHFYSNCGESALHMDKGRCDSILKLYPNCPLMLTLNTDVPSGEANGSRINLRSINVRPGEKPFILRTACGTLIRAFYASQIDSLTVKHENEDIQPPTFQVACKSNTFVCKIRIGTENLVTRMRANQFPVVSNSCTTGHKLQGCTVDNILVNHFDYSRNWAYVVLSRVRTMKGLYLRDLLSTDLKKYQKPEEMILMLEDLRKAISVTVLSEKEYEDMLTDNS